ncbi:MULTISPECIES: hypothetical protein [unclassified Anabaena]|jgi:hypothetical protein|uniref:Uncharacterized protein n=1 Tax=Dolichospermum flos-aquae UHCC 0037 TaxID=2590026 RepID=A0ACC7S5I0_DOLFA|nr:MULTISPECIES: hypothetical protein [unclassified Anabaena]MTJ43449.1 hypothetical protein [Dolichospermum flos-aquae UHCC 0037]OBQ17420.1 MAG: hypothetical protein AN486_15340 [Anabaena sp. AL93]
MTVNYVPPRVAATRLGVSPKSRVYWIRGTGGTGDNMFALVNNQDCQSMDGYNYLLKCGD